MLGPPGATLSLCDMLTGDVCQVRTDQRPLSVAVLAHVRNPAHAELVDLDRDGVSDWLVADLGSALPADHADGRVLWLRGDVAGTLDVVTLADGLGRVADAEAADFDGDGDLDVIVAEFGWHGTGSLFWLEQTAADGLPADISSLAFRRHEIDPRHGASHLATTDLNGDGALDCVVLISQAHETILAYLNDGQGAFRPAVLFAAEQPSFGLSGMELVDLDSDGDQDVLFTNGDAFDSFLMRPEHAVRWLENSGGLQFSQHMLTLLPGASRAVAADLDGDGDLDVAASAYLPAQARDQLEDPRYATLLWLEQIAPGRFERHPLETSEWGHLALCVGDFDGDQDVDVATGERTGPAWVTCWWNDSSRGAAALAPATAAGLPAASPAGSPRSRRD